MQDGCVEIWNKVEVYLSVYVGELCYVWEKECKVLFF